MFRNGLQGWHILVLLVVILLLFGAQRLPGLARSVGESLRIFKKEIKDVTADGDTGTASDGAGAPAAPVAQVPLIPSLQDPGMPVPQTPVPPAPVVRETPPSSGTTADDLKPYDTPK